MKLKPVQRYWLYFVLFLSGVHMMRDIFQDSGIINVLSSVFVKQSGYRLPYPWRSGVTYAIAALEIVLAMYCLKRNRFATIGTITVLIFVFSILSWSYYYFFLRKS